MTFYTSYVQGTYSSNTLKTERALIVGIERPSSESTLEESLLELERLVDTAGAQVVARATQKLAKPHPATFIGSGKAQELATLCLEQDIQLVVIDEELSPTQQSNLEKIVPKSVKVIDRTALILDIFALHANTKEGVLQVRLAQNQYLLPRLRGMWSHLASNRMGGGVGSRFGEGESQLEVDRRMVRARITKIKRELERVALVRETQRKQRSESGIFRVALAGYTNAGKSSLLNALCDASVLSYDKLFATLDATTRKYQLEDGRELTLTDTVGFIQKLPHSLIEAFKSTLEEIVQAQLILHVVDASSEQRDAHINAVGEVLEQIGAHTIKQLLIFNKCDLLDDTMRTTLAKRYPHALCISSHTHEGFDTLREKLSLCASEHDTYCTLCLPYSKGALKASLHAHARIVEERYEADGIYLNAWIPEKQVGYYQEYLLS